MARILVIEDNLHNMYLCSYILKKSNHEVLQAYCGPDGINMCKKMAPDLIILDIQLPEMDGYAVARAIKSDPSTNHIPIVAVTSYAMAGDKEHALAAGCQGYIEKPINPDTFMDEISGHLK